MTTEQTFASVWDAIEDTPAEAENMKVRSALMMQLNQHLEQLPGTDAETANHSSGKYSGNSREKARKHGKKPF